MGKLYFVRHGQSEWNVQRRVCGATDIPLSELGREQAETTGNIILERGIRADLILYSPLSRARETALTISRITGIPAREEPRLKEQNMGRFEGASWDLQDFHEMKGHFADRYGGTGESMLRLAQRVYNLLDELRDDGKTYILVAHNGIVRSVQSYFYDETNEEYAEFGIPNCEVVEFDWSTAVL